MADVTLLVENCITCALFVTSAGFFAFIVFSSYNKPESELSVVAERMKKEAQDYISMMTSQCELSLEIVAVNL
jgi:hypothetical protein